MLRIAFLFCLMLLAGCGGPSNGDSAPAAPPIVFEPGVCDVRYPDNSSAPCTQNAVILTTTASKQGTICSEESVAGPQGTIRILRQAGSTETLLSLAINGAHTSGIVQLRSNPAKMWAWRDARGDETWSIGNLPEGESLFIQAYTFTIRDANETSLPIVFEQNWSSFNGSPFAVHRIVANGSEYFLTRMSGFEQGGQTTYALASFDQFIGEHLFEARHKRVITVTLAAHAVPSCM